MAKLLSHPVAVFIICALSSIARLLGLNLSGCSWELILLKSIHEGGHKQKFLIIYPYPRSDFSSLIPLTLAAKLEFY